MKDLLNILQDTLKNKKDNGSSGSGLGGLFGSAAAGGLIGALFGGSKGLRNAAKNTLVVGGSAAAAALAYSIFKKWQQNRGQEPNTAVNPAAAAADDSALLLEAMIFAARADGHIDDNEQAMISKITGQLINDPSVQTQIANLMQAPLNPEDLARKAKSAGRGEDIYRISAAVIVADTFMERSYLQGLAAALGLSEDAKAKLDQEAGILRSQSGSTLPTAQ